MWCVERYPLDRLPDAGGLDDTVVVTLPVETLHGATVHPDRTVSLHRRC